jgi:hypothetical protein
MSVSLKPPLLIGFPFEPDLSFALVRSPDSFTSWFNIVANLVSDLQLQADCACVKRSGVLSVDSAESNTQLTSKHRKMGVE